MYALDQAAIDQAMIDLDGTEKQSATLALTLCWAFQWLLLKAAALQADVSAL